MSALHPCVACQRHIAVSETACPFCSAAVPEGFGAAAASRTAGLAINRPLSRAAILFAGATAIAACSSGTPATGSSGSSGSTSGDVQTLYGPAPVDAADDVTDSAPAQDAPGPVALYGPAPVDAGNG